MLVARGAAQVMVDPIVALWDYLPLEPIVREAGGTMTQLDGSPLAHDGSCLTTCGGAIQAAVLEIAAEPNAGEAIAVVDRLCGHRMLAEGGLGRRRAPSANRQSSSALPDA